MKVLKTVIVMRRSMVNQMKNETGSTDIIAMKNIYLPKVDVI
jgi:hypothetical protein